MNFRPWWRDCLMEKPHLITRFFGSKLMTKLGALAFPMFILHGPLGQIFYKKKLGNCFFSGRSGSPKMCKASVFVLNLASCEECTDGTLTRDPENRRSIGKVPAYEA